MQQKGAIQIIEWEDLDKRKFYSLGVFMTLTTRATVYPASLIRTRLQVQRGTALYSGTFDAFCKILQAEGVQGLYRGFMINTFTLVSGQAYITTYELVRKYVSQYSPSNTVKSVVAGGAASLVAQTITVPIDVVSQQLMMQGQGEHLTRFKVKPKMVLAATKRRLTFGQTRDIMVQIFAADGFKGFYRGYVASLLTYIPNSALWWPFYHFYAGKTAPRALWFLLAENKILVGGEVHQMSVWCFLIILESNSCICWSELSILASHCFNILFVHRAALLVGTKWVPPSDSAGYSRTNGSSNCLHHYQPHGCCSCESAGKAAIVQRS